MQTLIPSYFFDRCYQKVSMNIAKLSLEIRIYQNLPLTFIATFTALHKLTSGRQSDYNSCSDKAAKATPTLMQQLLRVLVTATSKSFISEPNHDCI